MIILPDLRKWFRLLDGFPNTEPTSSATLTRVSEWCCAAASRPGSSGSGFSGDPEQKEASNESWCDNWKWGFKMFMELKLLQSNLFY